MSELRLGDVIDDYCIKCRRVTNHSIVSILNGEAAKVRCRTCYHDHDYRHEEVPPSKKDLKKAELLAASLAAAAANPATPAGSAAPVPDDELLARELTPADEEDAVPESPHGSAAPIPDDELLARAELTPADEPPDEEAAPGEPPKAQKKARKTVRK